MAYTYGSDYLERLTTRWNAASFPIISKLVRNVLRGQAPRTAAGLWSRRRRLRRVLAESGGEVLACDVSESCLAASRGKYSGAFLIGDAADLQDASFGFIFSTEVLEHIADYESTIRHLYRALAPAARSC